MCTINFKAHFRLKQQPFNLKKLVHFIDCIDSGAVTLKKAKLSESWEAFLNTKNDHDAIGNAPLIIAPPFATPIPDQPANSQVTEV